MTGGPADRRRAGRAGGADPAGRAGRRLARSGRRRSWARWRCSTGCATAPAAATTGSRTTRSGCRRSTLTPTCAVRAGARGGRARRRRVAGALDDLGDRAPLALWVSGTVTSATWPGARSPWWARGPARRTASTSRPSSRPGWATAAGRSCPAARTASTPRRTAARWPSTGRRSRCWPAASTSPIRQRTTACCARSARRCRGVRAAARLAAHPAAGSSDRNRVIAALGRGTVVVEAAHPQRGAQHGRPRRGAVPDGDGGPWPGHLAAVGRLPRAAADPWSGPGHRRRGRARPGRRPRLDAQRPRGAARRGRTTGYDAVALRVLEALPVQPVAGPGRQRRPGGRPGRADRPAARWAVLAAPGLAETGRTAAGAAGSRCCPDDRRRGAAEVRGSLCSAPVLRRGPSRVTVSSVGDEAGRRVSGSRPDRRPAAGSRRRAGGLRAGTCAPSAACPRTRCAPTSATSPRCSTTPARMGRAELARLDLPVLRSWLAGQASRGDGPHHARPPGRGRAYVHRLGWPATGLLADRPGRPARHAAHGTHAARRAAPGRGRRAARRRRGWQPTTTSPTAVRDVAVLEVLYASGIRVGELCGLDVNDVDRARRVLRVLGKGAKERTVPVGMPALTGRSSAGWTQGRPALAGPGSGDGAVPRRPGRPDRPADGAPGRPRAARARPGGA